MEDFRRGMQLAILGLFLLAVRRFVFHIAASIGYSSTSAIDGTAGLQFFWTAVLLIAIGIAFRLLVQEKPTRVALIFLALSAIWAIFSSLLELPENFAPLILYWMGKFVAGLLFIAGGWFVWKGQSQTAEP